MDRLYIQMRGPMHLEPVGIGAYEAAPSVVEPFDIAPARVPEACLEDGLALARINAGAWR